MWVLVFLLAPAWSKTCLGMLTTAEVLQGPAGQSFVALIGELRNKNSEYRKKIEIAASFVAQAGSTHALEQALAPFTQAAANHLASQGVTFEVKDSAIIITPSEATELNRSAATLKRKYNTELRFDPVGSINEGFNGSFEARPPNWGNIIHLGSDAILNPHRKEIIIAHETGHARTLLWEIEGKKFPYYGKIQVVRSSRGTFPKVGETSLYPRYMLIDEFYTFYNDFLRRTRRGEKLESYEDSGTSALAKYQHLEHIHQRLKWLSEVVNKNPSAQRSVTLNPNTQQYQMTMTLPLDPEGNAFELTLPLLNSTGPGHPDNDRIFREQIDLMVRDMDKKWAFAQRIYEMRKEGIHLLAGEALSTATNP